MALQTDQWGYTNPIVQPLYGEPPLIWRDAEIHLVVYETAWENIERLIPAPLKPRTNTVIVWHSRLELAATQGSFSGEAAIYVQVEYDGLEGDYEPFLYVDSHLPVVAGREIWGYQKKMVDAVQIVREMEAVRAQTDRLGHQIMKALVVPVREADISEVPWSRDGVFSLKYIPATDEGATPLRELVLTEGKFTSQPGKFFAGPASVTFERSEIDPTYILAPEKIIGGFFGKGDLFLPKGRVVHNYS
ncbi:MAG: acetoacetate decarboxylase family protein [Bifidobacteriaceae bacterium]|jgi:acetoacetate decarboxylase|nr:acetoacetate decarboxylase family protein [Bifidobacteriaceae bacterium]